MSLPAIQLLIGFPSTSPSPSFKLAHSVLDGSDELAPASAATVLVDVSTWLTQTWTLSRGRSRETDQHQAGTLNFMLRNEDRRFDPTNTSSPYYPGITPRTPVQLFVAGLQIFGGYMDDFGLDYLQPRTATVAGAALDGFALLATATLVGYTALQEYSGQRVFHVLQRSEVQYPGPYSLDTGLFQLQASVQSGVAALNHCQTATASEGGMLYCDRTGKLIFNDHTFVPRAATANPNGVMTFTDTGVSYSGPAIGYEQVGMLSASTLLFNQVQGTRTGGDQQEADDLVSQGKYSIRSLSLPSLENFSDADVLSLCDFYVGRYAEPEVRFDTIAVQLAGLSPTNQAAICALDIGSVVVVERTPPGGGPAIRQLSMVELMSWSFDASAGSGMLTLGLMNISRQDAVSFILDSATQGILNTSKLAF